MNFFINADRSEEKPVAIKRIEEVTGKKVKFFNVDIRNAEALSSIFQTVSLL